jgi:hypothetical protein
MLRILSVLITLAVAAVAALGGVRFMDSVGPDIAGSSSSASTDREEFDVTSDESLLEPEGFGKVLAKIRKDYGSETRVVNLRLEPTRVDVQIPQGPRKTVLVQYGPGAKENFKNETDVDLSNNPNYASITRIPAAAPKRIMKKIAKKTGQPLDDLSYMTITTFGDGVGWYVSLEQGEETTWRAELDGTKVRAQ